MLHTLYGQSLRYDCNYFKVTTRDMVQQHLTRKSSEKAELARGSSATQLDRGCNYCYQSVSLCWSVGEAPKKKTSH